MTKTKCTQSVECTYLYNEIPFVYLVNKTQIECKYTPEMCN